MPEVTIEIGGRAFEVACQEGEESYLHTAAKMLDEEAAVLSAQVGRVPEARMLLMAGLMLADKTANLQDRLSTVEAELVALRAAPAPEPERVEVPVVPDTVIDTLSEIAARAEALADTVDADTGDAGAADADTGDAGAADPDTADAGAADPAKAE